MVRKKNQGFSLIEVVVAVAILSLLLAPIISQVIQTLHVSAQAKERQRAVEHAEYLLNCVQDIPISDLNGVANKLGEASSPAEGVGEDETTTVTTTSNSVKLKTGDTELEFTGAVAKPTVEVKIHSCTSYGDITSYANRGYKDGDPKKGPIGVPVISKEMVENSLKSTYMVKKEGEEAETYPTYSATIYYLENDKLNKDSFVRNDIKYKRTVIVDNLRSLISASGYVVETDFDTTAVAFLKSKGYEITTEGAAVLRDDETGLIKEIICSKVTGIQNPNGKGVSYMQDLDSSKVAIIQGVASNFDEQAANDLFNLKMNRLKAENPDAWVQAMNSLSGSILDGALFNDNVSKLTKISIVSGMALKEGSTTEKIKYYDVECTVYYEDYLTKSGSFKGGASTDAAEGVSDVTVDEAKPEVLTYNAFYKRFYTNQAPDIYFVYEPYIANGLNYSRNDYIVTHDGVIYDDEHGEKHSKLYIIKPNVGRTGEKFKVLTKKPEDWAYNYTSYFEVSDGKFVSVSATKDGEGESTAPDWADGKYYDRDDVFSTRLNSSSAKSVNIYLDYLKGENTNILPIYTNINTNLFTYSSSKGLREGVQYSGNLEEYYGCVESSSTTNVDRKTRKKLDRTVYPSDIVKNINLDTMYSDRVFTVTVQLDKLDKDSTTDNEKTVSGYTVRLSGAKGAE